MKIRKEDLQDLYPLTPMQEGILFHARQEGRGSPYVEQVVWRVDGPFNEGLYHQAWDELHARYEVLRSVFTHEKTREPLRLVLKERRADYHLEVLPDLSGQARVREREAGFDLSHGPLLRVRVYQLEPEKHEIVLTWHHILLDGWSTHRMLQDLFALYLGLTTGKPAQLAPLPSYAPYVEWLRTRDAEASLAWWRKLLDGYEATAEIPRLQEGMNRPFDLQRIDFRLGAAAHAALQELAAVKNATASSVVHAAWAAVLGRYCDSGDVVSGAVVSGRSPDVPEIENLPGLFINTVPVRAKFTAEDTFAILIERVQTQFIESQAHHYCRLAEVQNQCELRSDLLKHLVVFENYPITRQDADSAGVTLEVVETSEPTTYDLIVVVDPEPELRIELQYNAAVYGSDQIRQLARHLKSFLRQAIDNPDVPLARLDILSTVEREYLRHGFNATAREYPRDTSLGAQFASCVRKSGERTALVQDGIALTYSDLDRNSNRLAWHLAACGVSRGDRVATVLERSRQLVEAILAIVKLGASYVPQDPSAPAERLPIVLDDSGIRLIVTDTASEPRLRNTRVIRLDADRSLIDVCSDEPVAARAQAEDEAYLLYTSGSTGVPKGVRVSHRAVLRLVCNTDYVTLGTDDRVAHLSNVAFDAATFEIWGALLNGAELHLISKATALTPTVLSRELRARRITTLFLTTALFNQVAREAPDAFAAVSTLLFGGEQVDVRWVKRVIERGAPRRLLHVYGPTEATTFATSHLVTAVTNKTTIPIGQPIANTTAYVVDREMRLQPLGAVGELLLGGDGIAMEYHNRPELSTERFIPHPFESGGGRLYRTGDIVRRNADGELEFIGRRDHQVKLRGFRVELGEVENAIRNFPNAAEALVVMHQDEASGDRRLIAYLTMLTPPERSADLALRNHLRRLLPGYMIPSAFVILEHFPLTANGKVDRSALPAWSRSGAGFGRTFVAPATDTEKQVARIWETILNITGAGRNDNFFELGGHSLTASTAISHIRAELRVDVPLAMFFECPTLAVLTAEIERLRQSGVEQPTGIKRISRAAYQVAGSADRP